MKKIFSFVFVVTAMTGNAWAAEKPAPPVAVGFVNAVGLASRTDFQIDGKSVKPAGFIEGGYASSFGLAEGNHVLTCDNGDSVRATLSVHVEAGSCPLYVLHKTTVRQPDGNSKNILRLTAVPSQPRPQGPRFFALSTLVNRAAVVRVNGSEMQIDPFKLSPLAGRTLEVQCEGRKLVRYDPGDPANYVLVLFDGSDSRLRSVLVEMAK